MDFTGAIVNGDSVYGQTINCAEITQSILDSGMITSYIGYLGTSGDYADVEPTLNYGVYEDFELGTATYSTNPTSNGGIGESGNNGALSIRFIIIPGAVLATTDNFKGLSKTQIQEMSYDDLNKATGGKLKPSSN